MLYFGIKIYPNIVILQRIGSYSVNIDILAKKANLDITTGDLTKLETIIFLKKKYDKLPKPTLITADGGHDVNQENMQSQELFPLILGEVIAAIMVCVKGGNFVLKIFSTVVIIFVCTDLISDSSKVLSLSL